MPSTTQILAVTWLAPIACYPSGSIAILGLRLEKQNQSNFARDSDPVCGSSQTRDLIDDMTQLDQMLYAAAKNEYQKVRAVASCCTWGCSLFLFHVFVERCAVPSSTHVLVGVMARFRVACIYR